MKRWPVILCRGGTVLLAVGLALLLVSFIPPLQSNFSSSLSISEGWVDEYETALTPQQTLRVTVTANGTVDVYLLETSAATIDTWISERNGWVGNVTLFDQFLEANSSLIAWHGEVHNGTIDHEYSPSTVIYIAFVVSSHSSDSQSIDYNFSLLSGKAPAAKVRILSEFAIPIGFVFTLPWLNELVRSKRKQDS